MWTVLTAALLMAAPEEQFDAPAIPAEWTHDHQAPKPDDELPRKDQSRLKFASQWRFRFKAFFLK